ncbi:hypothetical protein AC1031_003108 [Aphanomyces cochlioides]|nr:hypothetical protein AC1031_003108 [Aphanomyces cochlioides]
MQRYTPEKPLATALYGQVLLCRDTVTGDLVAIKRMDMAAAASKTIVGSNRHVSEDIAMEKHVHRALSAKGGHANVLRLRDDFQEAGYEHFVLDYCPGGELFDELDACGRFDVPTTLGYFRQIFAGVRFMHARGYAHRDVSLENVLLDAKRQCFVCDFGLAAEADTLQSASVGKSFYMAPEVVSGTLYDPKRADVWSLGIVLFMMVTGAPLFGVANDIDSRFHFMEVKGLRALVKAWNHEIDAQVMTLLERMLVVNPKERMTMNDVANHPCVGGEPTKKDKKSFGHTMKMLFRFKSSKIVDAPAY